MVDKLAITGGTHGNELTGVYLVKKWLSSPSLVKRNSFTTLPMLMNEKAIDEVRRYIDCDLNRAFNLNDLLDESLTSYEAKLAKKINSILGPKGVPKPKVDFIVDLHTTTANMGLSIVVSNESKLTWQAISYLCKKEPRLKVYRWQGDEEDAFVDSIATHGFAIEVGAVPQGVLRGDIFLETETLIYHLLDFVEAHNTNTLESLPTEIEIYTHQSLVDYPRQKDGDIMAMVHPDRQDRDFAPIEDGEPLFLTFEGKIIPYEGENLHTLFINEAAYYEKGFAMCLARKETKRIES